MKVDCCALYTGLAWAVACGLADVGVEEEAVGVEVGIDTFAGAVGGDLTFCFLAG